jgi:RpiB/LacA/LacB family sugar-phosphate isomerase
MVTDGAMERERIVQFRFVRIAIGADHAGFLLKEHLKQTLARLGHEVIDHGTTDEQPVDYPPICFDVGRAVAEGRADRGVVLGGSGHRCATISSLRCWRARTTMPTSSRWAAASSPSDWRMKSSRCG